MTSADAIPAPPDELAPVVGAHRVVLVTRRGCHLCEQAQEVIERAAGVGPAESGGAFDWTTVDVDAAGAEVVQAYGDLVPVTLVDGDAVAQWQLDEAELRAHLGPGRGAGLLGRLRWPGLGRAEAG